MNRNLAGALRRWGRDPAVLLVLACLVGLGLRLLCLGCKSLWLDEAISVRAAAATLPALWTGQVDRQHPPLYYTFLHYWLRLGNSEAVLRLSSALLGAAAIPAVYAVARRLASPLTAVSAAWLVSLSPLLVWYSQELRSYSLLTLLSLLMGLAVVSLCTRPHAGWWLLLVGAAAAALYTHYLAVFLLPAQALLVLVLHIQRRLRRSGVLLWLASYPAVLLLHWPWLRQPAAVFWGAALAGGPDPVIMITQRLGLTAEPTLASVTGVLLAGTVAALLLLYFFLPTAAWLERRRSAPGLRGALFLLMLAASVAFVIPRAYSLKKPAVAFWPYCLLVVAWFWPWLPRHTRALAWLLAASLIAALVNVTVVPKDQWRDVVRYIEEHRRPGDGLWLQPYFNISAYAYYADDVLTPVRVDVSHAPAALAEQAAPYARIWYVVGARGGDPSDPQRIVPTWLEQNRRRVESRAWHGIRLVLYAQPE